jgi:hypothetical protein
MPPIFPFFPIQYVPMAIPQISISRFTFASLSFLHFFHQIQPVGSSKFRKESIKVKGCSKMSPGANSRPFLPFPLFVEISQIDKCNRAEGTWDGFLFLVHSQMQIEYIPYLFDSHTCLHVIPPIFIQCGSGKKSQKGIRKIKAKKGCP